MRIDLKVPYADKDEAKKLGARWCAHSKTWYAIHDGVENMMRFIKWIPDGCIPDYDPNDEKNFWHEMNTRRREDKKRWRYLGKLRDEQRQMRKAEEYERKIREQEA